MIRFIIHSLIVLFLTALTQIGGLAWLLSLLVRQSMKKRLAIFLILYSTMSVSTIWIAPHFGREPLPCFEGGSLQMQTKLYCALNRQYVVPELKSALQDVSKKMRNKYADTRLLVLDANFPFFDGFPLLPHLSHSDGRKADIAFYYADKTGFLPNKTRSPIGYFAFEDGPTNCPQNLISLRWDLPWLQPLLADYDLEPARMTSVLDFLAKDARIGKILLEPHLENRFGVDSPKIRFQGCRAARHDDHIHLQL